MSRQRSDPSSQVRPQSSAGPSTLKQQSLGFTPLRSSKREADQSGASGKRRRRKEPDAALTSGTLSLPPSPPPPRLPHEFLQVTSKDFLQKTATPVPGVNYLPNLASASESARWYESLLALPQWYRPTLQIYGRSIVQSRSIIAFSKVPNLHLKYSGTEVEMHPWPEVLREMEAKCREAVGKEVRFNHAMLNYYPSGDTHIGRHSDNLENKVILTLSLGSPRTWVMTRRPPHGAKASAKRSGTKLPPPEKHQWEVRDGSLLLMQGKCQEEWTHEIPKTKKVKDGRISVTFRQLVYD